MVIKSGKKTDNLNALVSSGVTYMHITYLWNHNVSLVNNNEMDFFRSGRTSIRGSGIVKIFFIAW